MLMDEEIVKVTGADWWLPAMAFGMGAKSLAVSRTNFWCGIQISKMLDPRLKLQLFLTVLIL